MRIAIDYIPAMRQQAGIGRFTRELTAAVLAQPSDHDFVLLGPAQSSPPQGLVRSAGFSPLAGGAGRSPSVRWATLPASERIMGGVWHRLRLPVPIEWFTGPADLFHATDFLAPPCRSARPVVTVHDLSFLRHPEFADPRLARFLSATVPRSVQRAALVLADSEFTRTEIMSLLNVSPSKIKVVYGGVSPDFQPSDSPEAAHGILATYGLHQPYVLFVARLEPRKNIASLLRAYQLLVHRRQDPGPLVIGGGRGWLCEPLFQLAASLGLQDRVRFLGHLPDAHLPALLSLASVFVYPSHYEGFGLPPLEAMACGAPVVASDASCLPEVLGDAALFVPPLDVEGLAQAISRVQADQGLAGDLRLRGYERAARYTWQSSATQLLGAYEAACA